MRLLIAGSLGMERGGPYGKGEGKERDKGKGKGGKSQGKEEGKGSVLDGKGKGEGKDHSKEKGKGEGKEGKGTDIADDPSDPWHPDNTTHGWYWLGKNNPEHNIL